MPNRYLPVLIVVVAVQIYACNQPENTSVNLSELDTMSFANLSRNAYDYLNAKQKECDSLYLINDLEHWFYDQATGQITFSNNDTVKLIIDYEEVGSLSLVSNTWLWAWDNSTIEERVKTKIVKVRDYGQQRGFDKLRNAKWKADMYDGWEMTAIAAYLLKAKGAYRAPINDSLYSFMIFKNIRLTDSIP